MYKFENSVGLLVLMGQYVVEPLCRVLLVGKSGYRFIIALRCMPLIKVCSVS